MARIELAPKIVEDFDRIIDHLARHTRYVPELDIAFVLAVRAQREAGFPRDPAEP
ncbi:hypothetical protein [Castellaniella sp.]|uniref:hypothetical protein n=1 Tax=Castellaniella sp. TaxID=1955812 RepID=UPI0025C0CDBA|nr:hypothetical protein [Castellaniella sp.]